MLSLQVGTPYYIAPEVLKQKYNEKCDIWSCGVILYMLLSEVPPFRGDSLTETISKVELGKYSLETAEWLCISEEAKSFIRKLLNYDYKKRITAENALNHPWIHQYAQEEGLVEVSRIKSVLNNIKTFNATEKLQQVVMAYIIHSIDSNKEIEELKNIFQMLDKNGDGRLTFKELSEGFSQVFGETLSEIEMNKIMLEVDQDEDGYLGYEEFLQTTKNKKTLISDESLKFAFSLFDSNNDGVLSSFLLKRLKRFLETHIQSIWQDF